jgi:Transcriptional regulator
MSDNTPPTRREREREQHRQEILDAAEEIFAARGIEAATIEDIAKKADFAVGSIYNFFNGKNDLVCQVLMRLFRIRISEIEERVIPKIADPILALRTLVDLWVSHHIRHGAFLRVAFMARMAEGKFGFEGVEDAELRESTEIYTALNTRLFEAGIKAGVFHKINPRHIFTMVEGICRSFIFEWKRANDHRQKDDLAQELFSVVKIALTGKPA